MTKIILTRHGHVEGIVPERFRGRLDFALTATGKRQAELTARRIASTWDPTAIYTSPLRRCTATGAAIGDLVGVKPRPDPRLSDIDYGAWQGLTPDDARLRWPEEIELWYRAPHLASIPEGETLQLLLARTAAAINEVVRLHPKDIVVLVGHDSVNRVLLTYALDLPLSHYWRLKQEPCAISELSFDDGLFTVETINDAWHLKDIR